eukprot:GDKH01012465.1.p1 GENE.GDKH01012465.1~~GDKH01012465.1.p1  ORF type:complete len:62 (+),score=3.96 GDKH01012465.1:1-186(+)
MAARGRDRASPSGLLSAASLLFNWETAQLDVFGLRRRLPVHLFFDASAGEQTLSEDANMTG